MKPLFIAAVFAAGIFAAFRAEAQILMSGGTYVQNFDSLAGSGTANGWTNNVTLPGWYASKSAADAASYSAGAGTSTTGSFYSFGTNGVNSATDRALGSLASSSTTYAYGVRFTNNTTGTATNLIISFTGEQWRNVGSGNVQTLAFSYGVSTTPITNSYAAATWISFPVLNFNTPTFGASASALDGNNATNRQVFAGVPLTGVTIAPGQEIFLRWLDVDDTGSDSALAIDDLTVSFQSVATGTNPPPVSVSTNGAVTLMTYNVAGNGSTDWSTNAPQVQAIGRQLLYLHPDIITFIEIPYTNTWQMTNWVTAFMPGWR